MFKFTLLFYLVALASAFRGTRPNGVIHTTSFISMGFFDDVKNIFSDEGKENIKKLKELEMEQMWKAQQEILERRRDPRKMRQYEEERSAAREELAREKAIYKFQKKDEEGYDPLTDWKRLKDEGKIKIGKDLERDASTSRLGSEGLIDVRVDERMPYIEQGWVEEGSTDIDVMGTVMGFFRKKKEKKNQKNKKKK